MKGRILHEYALGVMRLTSPHTAKPRRPLSPHSAIVMTQQMPKKIPAPAGSRLTLAAQHPRPQAHMSVVSTDINVGN
jgi:hypothetical protein